MRLVKKPLIIKQKLVKKPFIKFIKIKNIICYRNSIYYRKYKQLREIKKCGDFVIIIASFS